MHREYISALQLAYFTVGFTLGSSFIFTTGIRFGGRTTWVAEIVAAVLGILIFMNIAYIVNKFPGKNLLEIFTGLTGQLLGRLFLLYFIFFALLIASLVIFTIQDMFTAAILTETPAWVFCLTLTLAIGYILRQGLEPTARTCEFLVPIIIPVLGLMFFAAMFMVKKQYLLPVFSVSPLDFTRAVVILTSFPHSEAFLLTSLALRLKDPQKALRALLLGLLVASLFLIIRSALSVGIFSDPLAKKLVFPTFTIARVIRFGRFVERIEGFLLFTWFFIIFIKVAVCLYVALQGLADLFGIKDFKELVYPLCLLVIPLSIKGYANYQEVPEFFAVALPVLTLPVSFLFLPLLTLLSSRNKRSRSRKKPA